MQSSDIIENRTLGWRGIRVPERAWRANAGELGGRFNPRLLTAMMIWTAHKTEEQL